jgi:hypothetical protein
MLIEDSIADDLYFRNVLNFVNRTRWNAFGIVQIGGKPQIAPYYLVPWGYGLCADM